MKEVSNGVEILILNVGFLLYTYVLIGDLSIRKT